MRVPEIPATSTPSPVAARRSTTRKRPFSIVISPKGASSRGMALPGGTSQSGFCQLTAPSAPRSSVMTGSTSVISSRACSPRSAESRLNEAVMRPISASRSGSGPVETIVVAGSVTRGSGQNRTSGSPLIVLFPPRPVVEHPLHRRAGLGRRNHERQRGIVRGGEGDAYGGRPNEVASAKPRPQARIAQYLEHLPRHSVGLAIASGKPLG